MTDNGKVDMTNSMEDSHEDENRATDLVDLAGRNVLVEAGLGRQVQMG